MSHEHDLNLLSACGEAALVFDHSWMVCGCNQEALTLLELHKSELLGRAASSLLPELWQGNRLKPGCIKLRHRVYLRVIVPESALQGGQRLVILKNDTANFLNKAYLSTLNHLSESAVICDEEGYFLHFNDAAGRQECMVPENVIGRNLRDVYTIYSNGGMYYCLEVLSTGKPLLNRRQHYATEHGKVLDSVSNTYPLIVDEKICGAICLLEDYAKLDILNKKILDLQSQLSEQRQREKDGNKQKKSMAQYRFNDIISISPTIKHEIQKCRHAAKSDSHILIYGETGTGKELFAQSIHNASDRANGPFVAINCAAIPDNLQESMLFGTERGAYTGAEKRKGLFEQAHTGTLLLDEINSMSLALQSKLLRVLQESTIRKLGGSDEIRVDVRVISNTNIPPYEAVEKGLIRQDLFYRLGAVTINIPPLRERREDIPLLCKTFILRFNHKMLKNVNNISPEVYDIFTRHAWPGNVRELQHAIEHAMNIILPNNSMITPRLLPEHILKAVNWQSAGQKSKTAQPKDTGESWNDVMRNAEIKVLTRTLREHQGNISRAARALGLSRQSLQYYINKHNIVIPRSETNS